MSDEPTLRDIFERQHRLQVEAFKIDPCKLTHEDLAEYIRWNMLALHDELSEALAETNWKVWASAEPGIRNQDAFINELVDAFHFMMNLVLAASHDPTSAAAHFIAAYTAKAKCNEQRQREGYTGLNKCGSCHRDVAEAGTLEVTLDNGEVATVCAVCLTPVVSSTA